MTASTSRRTFLRASALTSAVFGAERALAAADTRRAAGNGGEARNVILMVSDGMNHGALSLARQFRALEGGGETNWFRLYRERPVVRSLVETCSLNSCVTDSAAAASAWGGGQRVANGAVNILSGKEPVRTLHEKLQAAGRRTGLVTTATVTHATPAGFAANVPSRSDEAAIARQYHERKVDVLLGGGAKFFPDGLRTGFASAGYDLARSRDELLALPKSAKPLLGVFADSHLPFSIDRSHVPAIAARVPTLAEMTRVALDRLAGGGEGFFLLVEGARIDHAGHNNDAAASIHDQLAFDDAIGTVLGFLETHPDTLLVLTTDHGCGGIQMNGVNGDPKLGDPARLYSASSAAFERLRGFRRSFEWMHQNGIAGLSGPPLAAALKDHTGLALTGDEIKAAQGVKLKIADVFQAHHGVGWTSAFHTGELVEFCALGPGSERFPAFHRNFEAHGHILAALGVPA